MNLKIFDMNDFKNAQMQLQYAASKYFEWKNYRTKENFIGNYKDRFFLMILDPDQVPAAASFRKQAERLGLVKPNEPFSLGYNGLNIMVADNIHITHISDTVIGTWYEEVKFKHTIVSRGNINGHSSEIIAGLDMNPTLAFFKDGEFKTEERKNIVVKKYPEHLPCVYNCVDTRAFSRSLSSLKCSITSDIYRLVVDGGLISYTPIVLGGNNCAALTPFEREELEKNVAFAGKSDNLYQRSTATIKKALENVTGESVTDALLPEKAWECMVEITKRLEKVLAENSYSVITGTANWATFWSDYGTEKIEEARKMITRTEENDTRIGRITPMFINSDLLVLSNYVYSFGGVNGKNPCSKFGGPEFSFPLKTVGLKNNLAMFRAFQKALFSANMGIPLLFACEDSWGDKLKREKW